jgi:hypothetical protein
MSKFAHDLLIQIQISRSWLDAPSCGSSLFIAACRHLCRFYGTTYSADRCQLQPPQSFSAALLPVFKCYMWSRGHAETAIHTTSPV